MIERVVVFLYINTVEQNTNNLKLAIEARVMHLLSVCVKHICVVRYMRNLLS